MRRVRAGPDGVPPVTESIPYDVWVKGLLAEDVALLESLNADGGFPLRLPVQPWPATLTQEDSRLIRLSGEAPEGRLSDVVGAPVGTSPFRPEHVRWQHFDNWNHTKFVQFVRSHEHLLLPWTVDGQPCPTLTALAAYLFRDMLVSYSLHGTRRLVFVTAWGETTEAEYTGDAAGLAEIRSTFFSRNRDTALRLPGLKVLSGQIDPHPIERTAMLRRDQLQDWKQARNRGRQQVPEGAELTHHDLKLAENGDWNVRRLVIAAARSSKHLYEVIVPPAGELEPLDVQCAVDGIFRNFRDPVTGQDRGQGAWVSDWADWILADSAPDPGGTDAQQPWEGSGTESEMYRLEHNIVHYSEHETDTARFGSAAELLVWLKRSLGNHNAPLGVHLLDDLVPVLRDYLPMFHHAELDPAGSAEPTIRYVPRRFHPWEGFANWLDADGAEYSRHPLLSTVMDGQRLEAFTAVNCVDYDSLSNDLLPADAPATEHSWFIVALENTTTCMVFPARGTLLTVSTDHDGASATIVPREASGRQREIDRETAFEQQWDRWLNDDRPLTKNEIQEGLDTVGQMIRGAVS